MSSSNSKPKPIIVAELVEFSTSNFGPRGGKARPDAMDVPYKELTQVPINRTLSQCILIKDGHVEFRGPKGSGLYAQIRNLMASLNMMRQWGREQGGRGHG